MTAEKKRELRGLNAVAASGQVTKAGAIRDEHVAFVSGARIVFFTALLATVVLARNVWLMVFFSLLISFALSFPVGWLSRRLPRGLAVILSLVLVLGGFTALGFAVAPVLSSQFRSVAKVLPGTVQRFEEWAGRAGPNTGQSQVTEQVSKLVTTGVNAVFPAALGALSGVSAAILILVLAAFLVHQPDIYLRGARTLVPERLEPAFDEGARRLARGLRHWIAGIMISMLIMGCCTAIGLKIAGIQNWLLLGVLTALGTFIPYLGAICSAVPGVLMGLSQSPHFFFMACLVYLCVHIIEGYIVQPFVMKKAVEVRPALLLIGQAVFGVLLGLPGVIVASPLLVCLQICIGYYYVERQLGKAA